MTAIPTPRTLRLTQIGNSLGITLPVDILEAPGIRLSAEDPDFKNKLAALREVIEHYDDALRELAK